MAIGAAGQQVPQASQLTTSPTTVVWSDGSLFDGYLWVGVVLPTPGPGQSASAVPYTTPFLWAASRAQALPQYVKVPIVNGLIDQTTQLFFNANMDPPGTSYVAYWFDRNNAMIAPANGAATPFTVTSLTTTITVPTLTLPNYSGAVAPVPQFSSNP